MVLRLPYQIKKIADTNPRIPPPVFEHSWFYYLSEVSNTVWYLFYFSIQIIRTYLNVLLFLPLLVSDDSTDTICQEASQKALTVYLWLKRKISSAAGPAYPWFPCAQCQKTVGGAGHFPKVRGCHCFLWLSSTVWHTHQSGEWSPLKRTFIL